MSAQVNVLNSSRPSESPLPQHSLQQCLLLSVLCSDHLLLDISQVNYTLFKLSDMGKLLCNFVTRNTLFACEAFTMTSETQPEELYRFLLQPPAPITATSATISDLLICNNNATTSRDILNSSENHQTTISITVPEQSAENQEDKEGSDFADENPVAYFNAKRRSLQGPYIGSINILEGDGSPSNKFRRQEETRRESMSSAGSSAAQGLLSQNFSNQFLQNRMSRAPSHPSASGKPGSRESAMNQRSPAVSSPHNSFRPKTLTKRHSDTAMTVIASPQTTTNWLGVVGSRSIFLIHQLDKAPKRTQAALLEVLANRAVYLSDRLYKLKENFVCVATIVKPHDSEDSQLLRSLVDKFLLHSFVTDHNFLKSFKDPTYTSQDLESLRSFVENIQISHKIKGYIGEILSATKQHPAVSGFPHPTTITSFMMAAKALAVIQLKNYVTPTHVIAVAPLVLSHRVLINYGGKASSKFKSICATTSNISSVRVPNTLQFILLILEKIPPPT